MLAATRVLSGISEPRSICASFTKLLPRREADRSVCHSRFPQVEPWEGQPGPRTYSFTREGDRSSAGAGGGGVDLPVGGAGGQARGARNSSLRLGGWGCRVASPE
jgi:hypothetical protein